jgi:predicted RNA-binding Zn-ribbon protein involved in translation (DUF1610 family)
MHCYDVAPSRLPSLLLPCPHCGHRMVITAVEPALFADGATANDLQDVTHSCEQCGTELTRTVRLLASVPDSVFPSHGRARVPMAGAFG